MDLITAHYNNIANVSSVSECKQLLTDYKNVLNGRLRSLPGQVHLQVDETVTLHTAAMGHIPVSMFPQVKKETPYLVICGRRLVLTYLNLTASVAKTQRSPAPLTVSSSASAVASKDTNN